MSDLGQERPQASPPSRAAALTAKGRLVAKGLERTAGAWVVQEGVLL